MKKFLKNNIFTKNFLLKMIYIFGILLLFYSFDVYLRYITKSIDAFYPLRAIIPNLITIVCICYFLPLVTLKSKKVSLIFLSLFYILGLFYFIANYMMLNVKSIPLDYYNLHNVGEGLEFINAISSYIGIKFILFILFTILLFIILFIIRKKIDFPLNKWKIISILILFPVCILINYFCIHNLESSEDEWQNISKPRYYYDNFINSKRSALVMGYYEYSIRDMYLYIKENYMSAYSKADADELFAKNDVKKENNEYTGIFAGKNLIMIMMESIDEIMINKEAMPTLYKMRNSGWNFTNRYSVLSNGGSTIVTEFNSLSGLFYNNAYYRINNNFYSNAIPNMFSNNGYITSSMHENYGTYYNRSELHRNLGFQNSYFVYEMLDNYEIYSDVQLISNYNLYEKIIPKTDKPFMSFIVTIAAHGPYTNSNSICSEDEKASSSEKDCMNYLAYRTDDLFSELLSKLKEDELLDDTVIIAYTDHQAYLYEYTDNDLKKFKKVDDDFNIKSIPMIIYSNDIKKKNIDVLINDVDIAPTIFNLFGLDYDAQKYIGTDIFSKYHKNIVMFENGSWYDGNVYSFNSGVDQTTEKFKTNSEWALDKRKLNDILISTNYYGK